MTSYVVLMVNYDESFMIHGGGGGGGRKKGILDPRIQSFPGLGGSISIFIQYLVMRSLYRLEKVI